MSNNSSMRIGTFTDTRTDKVPIKMRGKGIWYSDERKFFVITDENNDVVNDSSGKPMTFSIGKFSQFVDADVISFASDGMREHMMDVLDDWATNHRIADDNESDESSIKGTPSKIHDVMSENTVKSKDPTRFIPAFFATTLIISLIIVIMMNFGGPVLENIAPLLN